MTLGEITGAYSELGKSLRRTFWFAAVLAVASFLMVVSVLLPVKAKVTSAIFQVGGSSFAPPGAQPQPGQPPIAGFFTAQFDLEIPKRMKGQLIEIETVAFHDEKGKRLGELRVESINRRLRVRPTGPSPAPGSPPGAPGLSLTVKPVEGKLHLWPLEAGIVNFNAVSRTTMGIQPGQRIYAVVSGRSGVRGFEVRTSVGEARGFGL